MLSSVEHDKSYITSGQGSELFDTLLVFLKFFI